MWIKICKFIYINLSLTDTKITTKISYPIFLLIRESAKKWTSAEGTIATSEESAKRIQTCLETSISVINTFYIPLFPVQVQVNIKKVYLS